MIVKGDSNAPTYLVCPVHIGLYQHRAKHSVEAKCPLEADPAVFAVALTLPDGVEIAENSALLSFLVTRIDTGESREDILVLKRLATDKAVFRIAPGDLDALRSTQNIARDWKAESENNVKGSLGVTITPCKLGDRPDVNARASVAIRISEEGPFMPLINNGPISAVVQP